MAAHSWSVSTVEGQPGLLVTNTPTTVAPVDLDTEFFPVDQAAKLQWALRTARATLNHTDPGGVKHPWMPGAVFDGCPELAEILVAFVDDLLGEES